MKVIIDTIVLCALGQEYLKAAVRYLEDEAASGGGGARPEEIAAIWVASDDAIVINEVRALAPTYFPNVASNDIAWISGGEGGGAVTTRSELEVRISNPLCQAQLFVMVAGEQMHNQSAICSSPAATLDLTYSRFRLNNMNVSDVCHAKQVDTLRRRSFLSRHR